MTFFSKNVCFCFLQPSDFSQIARLLVTAREKKKGEGGKKERKEKRKKVKRERNKKKGGGGGGKKAKLNQVSVMTFTFQRYLYKGGLIFFRRLCAYGSELEVVLTTLRRRDSSDLENH